MSKGKNELPDAAEFGQLRAYLAKNKVKQKDIKEAIGDDVNGRTRGEIADLLRAWLKNREVL